MHGRGIGGYGLGMIPFFFSLFVYVDDEIWPVHVNKHFFCHLSTLYDGVDLSTCGNCHPSECHISDLTSVARRCTCYSIYY
jgi:hypothetical protein